MKEELAEELETFASWERMSTDYDQVLRATYKEFHHGCRYYKGKQKDYETWLRQTHPAAYVAPIERADGGRQDLDYDAAYPIYINRRYFIEYLHMFVFGKGHSNILEDFLYVIHRSLQYVAATRANGLMDLLVTRPMRWLTGSSAELMNWSPFSMGAVIDMVEELFLEGQHNGSIFLDPGLNDRFWEPIKLAQPKFAKYQDDMYNNTFILSPDGSKRHLLFKLALEELQQPKDLTNLATRDKTIEYLQV